MKLLPFLGTCAVLSQSAFCMDYYYVDQHCGETVQVLFSDQIRVQLSTPTAFENGCEFSVHVPDTLDQFKFMVQFRSMSIPEYSGFCSNNWLEVHDGSSRSSSSLTYPTKLCGYSAPGGIYRTSGNYVTFYYRTDSLTSYSSFDVIVTSYHTGFCDAGEYDCDNGLCIDDSLTCSGYNPCGDYSDCDVTIIIGGIVGGVVGGVVLIICVISILNVCRRRHRMIERAPMAVATTTAATAIPPPPGYNNPNYGTIKAAREVYP